LNSHEGYKHDKISNEVRLKGQEGMVARLEESAFVTNVQHTLKVCFCHKLSEHALRIFGQS